MMRNELTRGRRERKQQHTRWVEEWSEMRNKNDTERAGQWATESHSHRSRESETRETRVDYLDEREIEIAQ